MPRFIWPVANPVFSQHFGDNHDWYVANVGQQGHNGDDIAVQSGTPVHASADGTVFFEGAGADSTWMGAVAGNCIIIDHTDVLTGYAHLTSTVINKGDYVTQGQLIGYSGATGLTMGGSSPQPHLHFEFIGRPQAWKNGFAARLDPAQFVTQEQTNQTSQGGDMAEKANIDTARILAHGILARNGVSGRINALDGSCDADLNAGHVGAELTNEYIRGIFLSDEGRQWRDSQDSNSIQGVNARLNDNAINKQSITELQYQLKSEQDKSVGLVRSVTDLTSKLDDAHKQLVALQAQPVAPTVAVIDSTTKDQISTTNSGVQWLVDAIKAIFNRK